MNAPRETDRRYRVTIEETIIHEIEVTAVSENAAAIAAKKRFVADHPDHHDFDVADVEEIPAGKTAGRQGVDGRLKQYDPVNLKGTPRLMK